MEQKVGKKIIIALSHQIREQLAEVVLCTKSFRLDTKSKLLIYTNKSSWKSKPKKKITLISKCIEYTQKKLGLINFRIFFSRDANMVFSNGGFLITNKPYIAYIEKPTQIFGYTAKSYEKPIGRFMLNFFLRQKNLKFVFFRTEAALSGMLHIPLLGKRTEAMIKQKGTVIYPPIRNPHNTSTERFKNLRNIRFLFVTSAFYEKGGIELLNAFQRLRKRYGDRISLTIISRTNTMEDSDLRRIQSTAGITFSEPISRSKLYKQYYNTAHVFVYPTYSDSFSAVINEAISAYLPIISSDFFSIPERVIDQETGFLFNSPFKNYDQNMVIFEEHFTDDSSFPSDLPEKRSTGKLDYVEKFLEEKMAFFVENPKEIEVMAKKTKVLYENTFSGEKIATRIEDLFHQTVSKK